MNASRGAESTASALAPEIADRIGSILDSVENEAGRLHAEAREDAARYAERARHHIDQLVFERQRRISELSDELIAKSEAVVGHLDDAEPIRRGFENLVEALGDAAERLAGESEANRMQFGNEHEDISSDYRRIQT